VGESPSSAGDGRSAWTWLLPALTFLVGAALSAALFALGDTDGPELTAPRAAPTAEPTDGDLPSDEPEVVVQVPAACVKAAELAQTVTSALGDVADAAGALDARRLQESLDVVQQIRPEVEATATECRDLAAAARIVTQDPTAPATPSATPAG
jgi:hypothetical protein